MEYPASDRLPSETDYSASLPTSVAQIHQKVLE